MRVAEAIRVFSVLFGLEAVISQGDCAFVEDEILCGILDLSVKRVS